MPAIGFPAQGSPDGRDWSTSARYPAALRANQSRTCFGLAWKATSSIPARSSERAPSTARRGRRPSSSISCCSGRYRPKTNPLAGTETRYVRETTSPRIRSATCRSTAVSTGSRSGERLGPPSAAHSSGSGDSEVRGTTSVRVEVASKARSNGIIGETSRPGQHSLQAVGWSGSNVGRSGHEVDRPRNEGKGRREGPDRLTVDFDPDRVPGPRGWLQLHGAGDERPCSAQLHM